MRAIFNAIRQVESNGNDHAVGDDGRSKGPYQIQRQYWADGGGKPRDYDRLVWCAPACEAVMLGYWQRYCPSALARGDFETLARVHNGGPARAKKRATLGYWQHCQQAMRRAERVGRSSATASKTEADLGRGDDGRRIVSAAQSPARSDISTLR
jgi:hypothetical protein